MCVICQKVLLDYYVPAAKATQEEVDHVKSLFTGKTM